MKTPALSVQHLRGLSGLASLEDDWRRLADAASPPAYHHDFDWYRAYLREGWYDPDRVRFLVGTDADGRVRMICPVERRVEVIRKIPFRIWALPGSGTREPRLTDVRRMATACDLLCDWPEAEGGLLTLIRQHLRRIDSEPAILLFGSVTAGSTAWRVARAGLPGGGLDLTLDGFNILRTDLAFDELQAGLSKNFRGNLRKARNKLSAAGRVDHEVVGPGQELLSAYEEFLEVEASGWKGESGAGTAVALLPRVDAFLRSLLTSGDGALRPEIHLLRVDGTCIAAQFWIRYRDQMVLPKIGYDEAYSRLAPGQMLLERALEAFCPDESVRSVNLVEAWDWHQSWNPEHAVRHWFYAPIGKGRAFLPLTLLRLPTSAEVKEWIPGR